MENFDDFLGRIRKAFESLEEGWALIAQARAKTEEAGQALAKVTDGANDDRPHTAVSKMDASLDALDRADAHSLGSREEFTEYVGLIGGNLSGPTAPSTPPPAPEPVKARPSHGKLENFRPARRNAVARAEVERAGWPRNDEGKIRARAFLYDEEGHKMNTWAYVAQRDGEHDYRPELKPEFNQPEKTTSWHAEGQMAKEIRDHGITNGAIYINIPMCGGPRPGNETPNLQGCSENFRHIIPKDTVIWVHVIPEHGQPYQQKIVGTGEGIK